MSPRRTAGARETGAIKALNPSITFTLLGLSGSGFSYNGAVNYDPDNDCLSGYLGTAIMVLKP